MREAAAELDRLGGLPFAAHVSDPCDGRTQGTTGMFDSLPYRNDAALVLRRLVRSLPNRRGVIGVGTCDKGLPAMTDGASPRSGELAGAVDPRRGDAAAARAARTPAPCRRSARGSRTGSSRSRRRPTSAAAPARRPGGGCQFLGTAATVAGRRRGARADRAARRARPVGPADLARRRPAHRAWPCTTSGSDGRTLDDVLTRRGDRERDARPRRLRRLDEPPHPHPRRSPTPRACPGRPSTTGAASTAPCPGSSTRCRTGRRTIRPCASSSPAACPR